MTEYAIALSLSFRNFLNHDLFSGLHVHDLLLGILVAVAVVMIAVRLLNPPKA